MITLNTLIHLQKKEKPNINNSMTIPNYISCERQKENFTYDSNIIKQKHKSTKPNQTTEITKQRKSITIDTFNDNDGE